MPTPKEVLTPDDYAHFRTIRQLAVAFVIFGVVGILVAISMRPGDAVTVPSKQDDPLIPILVASVAVSNMICGVATWFGSRKLAPLLYASAVPQLLVFPIGTAMSFTLLKGLSEYLEGKEQVRVAQDEARSKAAPPDSAA